MQANVSDWPWKSCLEPQSFPQFVAASAVPGCVQEGSSCTPRLAFTSTGPMVVSKSIKGPKIHLYFPWPAGSLIGSVTKRASGYTQFARGKFTVSPQLGVSGVHQTDTDLISLPVLGVRPLSRCLRVYQIYLPPTWFP